MARRHSNRRRRRGRFSFLLKLLCFLVIIGAAFAALTLFFNMDHIIITGNEHYTQEEILEASGLKQGDNLYLMNKYSVKEKIFSKLPFVEEVSINRRLPDTLLIDLRECHGAAGIQSGSETWIISSKGKILLQVDEVPAGCAHVTGLELEQPVLGAQAVFAGENEYRSGVLMTLLECARERGMNTGLDNIDLTDETSLNFTYLNRFAVKMPWTADVDYKLECLATVVDYLEINEVGTINLMTDGKASFIPA